MRKTLKWIGIMLSSLIALVIIAVVIVLSIGRARFNETYDIDVPQLKLPADAESLARGKHLVTAVAHCGYCHGPDLSGEIMINNPRAEGIFVAPNLTAGEGGLGAVYNTDDWVRAIRHGVTPAGRSVMIMPSLFFYTMSEADLAAVIAYLETIPPVDNILPETQPGPMFYALIGAGPLAEEMSGRVLDHNAPFASAPAEGETAVYGAYLAEMGQCRACHGEALAGGQVSRSAPIGPNLTPGGELGDWTKADFAAALRSGIDPSGHQLDTYMPWPYFSQMSDTEVGALWSYLQAQPAQISVLP